jgi:hypothetical protein
MPPGHIKEEKGVAQSRLQVLEKEKSLVLA